jgi:hypothetical protein
MLEDGLRPCPGAIRCRPFRPATSGVSCLGLQFPWRGVLGARSPHSGRARGPVQRASGHRFSRPVRGKVRQCARPVNSGRQRQLLTHIDIYLARPMTLDRILPLAPGRATPRNSTSGGTDILMKSPIDRAGYESTVPSSWPRFVTEWRRGRRGAPRCPSRAKPAYRHRRGTRLAR